MVGDHDDPIGLARTNREAHLYMDVHPCECGSTSFDRRSSVTRHGAVLRSRYTGACASCGADRAFVFNLPDSPDPAPPSSFGSGPSELFDAVQWLAIADRYAQAVPAIPPDDAAQRARDAQWLRTALEAITQAQASLATDSTPEVDSEILESRRTAFRSVLRDYSAG